MTDAGPPTPSSPAEQDAPRPLTASESSWGRSLARGYFVVCVLALAWMAVESALRAPGGGTILSAALALPWSLFVAQALPLVPPAWSLAARFALLIVLMGLNGLVLRGMGARFQSDFKPRRG